MTSKTSRRRYELDWLRVLAILIVFVYHSSRFFNLGDRVYQLLHRHHNIVHAFHSEI